MHEPVGVYFVNNSRRNYNNNYFFCNLGEDLRPAWFEFELSDGLNEAAKESFNVTVRKPELMLHDGRLSLPVFPLTQSPLKPENLFVKSSDGREITFQVRTRLSLPHGLFAIILPTVVTVHYLTYFPKIWGNYRKLCRFAVSALHTVYAMMNMMTCSQVYEIYGRKLLK